jgi:hypothetical protein
MWSDLFGAKRSGGLDGETRRWTIFGSVPCLDAVEGRMWLGFSGSFSSRLSNRESSDKAHSASACSSRSLLVKGPPVSLRLEVLRETRSGIFEAVLRKPAMESRPC